VFVCAYLLFQALSPALPWLIPEDFQGDDPFTWRMYSNADDDADYSVVFADGSSQDVGDPQTPNGKVRVFSGSVDQRRFLPPWLCAHWDGARIVIARDPIRGRDEAIPCSSIVR